MKILRLRKSLSDETGSDGLAIQGHETPIRTARKQKLREASDRGRIYQSGQYCENEGKTKSGSKFFDHFSTSRQSQHHDQFVDRPDAGEWNDDASQSIN